MTQSPHPVSDRPATQLRRFLLPSLSDMVFVVGFFFALSMGGALSNRDGDLGRHLRLGKWMIDNHSIATTDVFSYTLAGSSMVPHEWLAQVLFAAVGDRWGYTGIAVLVGVIVALPWAFYTRILLSRGLRATAVIAAVLLGAFASAIHWVARPHIFTFVFIAVWVVMLDDFASGRRRHLWWLIPLTALWANVHGAFVMGLVLVATYLVGGLLDRFFGRRTDLGQSAHLAAVLVGSLIASLINPKGIGLITNSFGYLGQDFLIEFTNEYNSPDFHTWPFWPFLLLVFAVLLLRRGGSVTKYLLILSWAAFGFYSFRNIPIFALVVTPIFAADLNTWLDSRSDWASRRLPHRVRDPAWQGMHRSLVGGTVSALIVVLVLAGATGNAGNRYAFDPGNFPVEAMRQLAADPPGQRVFNQFEWGGYLLFCCWPDIPVFIDGQTDYYGTDLTQEYDRAVNAGPGWDEVLKHHDVDWVLIRPEQPLAQVLAVSTDWVEIYRDGTAVAFVPAGT